jgi:hypothetical protein
MQPEAIDNLVKTINERHQWWGVRVKDWEIVHKPGVSIVILLAEANSASFPASLAVIPQNGEVILGGAAYINLRLRYSTIRNCPQAAALPVAAYLLGCYLREIVPHLKPTMCVYPGFGEAYSLIQWWKGNLMKPTMGAKAIIRKRSHQITIVHYSEPDMEVETDIYNAPQILKVGVALCVI